MPQELLYGFRDLADVRNERVTETRVETVRDAIQATLDQHEEDTRNMQAIFCERVTKAKLRFKAAISNRSQKLDELGRALKVKMAGFYDVGFPLDKWGDAWGQTRVERVKSTIQDVNDTLALMLDGDNAQQRDQIIARLLSRQSYTFVDDTDGEVVVMPLANGDEQLYQIRAGNPANGEIADHYYAQVAPIADATNPYPAIYRKITRRPENRGGRVLAFIAENLQAPTEALGAFIEDDRDPDRRPPDDEEILIGTFDDENLPGTIIGKAGKVWICVWPALPDNYGFAIPVNGPRPVAMREHPEPELQGYGPIGVREDIPYWEQQYERHAGFGTWSRVGGVAFQIEGADAIYDTPAGYELPLP